MPGEVLFAGIAAAHLDAAIAWYQAVMGRPADIVVNTDEVMWRICDGGWLYLVREEERAGRSLAAVAVPELDRTVDELMARGLTPTASDTGRGRRVGSAPVAAGGAAGGAVRRSG
jgi:hypothetical protein